MRFLRSAIIAAAVVASLGPSAPLSAQTSMAGHNPIKITQCFITEPKPLSKKAGGTQINYVNMGHQNATNITFAVAYRNAESHYLRKITDTGVFVPGAEVQHHFSLFNDVTYAGKQTQGCQAIAVTWADGTHWSAMH